MQKSWSNRSVLLWLLLSAILATSAVFADTSRPIDVPPGPLVAALESLSKQMSIELVFEPEQLKGYTTGGVKGSYAPDAAVRILIKGTPLELHVDSGGAMVISLKRASSQSNNETPDGAGQAVVPSAERGALVPEVLEEVIVTAFKRSESLSHVGSAVSAISGDTLLERSADSLQDYVAFIPGVTLTSQGAAGYGVVSIRGIAPQGNGASTATYIDEIPVGASGTTTRSAFFTADLDPEDLDRVEVLKGPQGTLYGASSLGGVIKYVTRQPNLAGTEITLSEDFSALEHGSDGIKLRGSFSAAVIDGVLGVRASGYYRHDPGFVTDIGVGGEGIGRDNDTGGRLSVLYKPTEDLSVRLSAMVQENRQIGLSVVDTDTTTFQPAYGSYNQLRYEREGLAESTRLYSAEINYHFGLFDLVSATGYSQLYPTGYADDTLSFQAYGLGPVSPQNPAQDVSNDNTNKLTQEIRLVSRRIGIAEFMLGGFYQHEQDHFSFVDTLTATPGVNFSTRGSNGTLTEYAGFLDATLYFSPRFDFTAGYRYSKIHQDLSQYSTGSLYNPIAPNEVTTTAQTFSEGPSTYLAAARYHVTDDLLLYARAASGYRPGGGRVLPPGTPPGFPDYYTSDKIWSYEVGEKYKGLNGRLSIDADAFWIDWSNIQSLQTVPGTPFVLNGNAGTANSRGVELQSAYVPLRGWTVGINGAYTDARFTQTVPLVANDGDTLTYVPKVAWSAYSEYVRPVLNGWNGIVAGDYRFEGYRVDTYRVPLPGYGVWGARAGLRSDRFQVTLYVKNLTDKYAREGSNGGGGGPLPYYFVIETPRTIGLSFIEKF
jgi:outer membrane receptor protein involved in Fe transport